MELELQPLDSDLARGLLAGLPPSAMQKSVPLSSGGIDMSAPLLDASASGAAGASRLGRSSRVRSESLGNGIGFGTSIDLGINMDIGLAGRSGSPGLFGGGGSFLAGGGGGGRTRSDSLFGGVGAPPLMGTQWTTSSTVQNPISLFAPIFNSTVAAAAGIVLPSSSSAVAPASSSATKQRPHGEKRPRGISAQFAIDAGSFDAGPMFGGGAVYGNEPVLPRRARASSDMDNSNNFGGVVGGGGALLGRSLQARRDTLGGLTEGILPQSQAFASAADIWAQNDSDNEETGVASAGRGGMPSIVGFQSSGVYTADDGTIGSMSSSSAAPFLRSEPGVMSQPANYQFQQQQQQQQPQQNKQLKGRSKLGVAAANAPTISVSNAPGNPRNSTASDISVNSLSQTQQQNSGASTSSTGQAYRNPTSRDVHTPTLSFSSTAPVFANGGVFGAPPKMQGSLPGPPPQFTVPKQQIVMPYIPIPPSIPSSIANLKGKAVGATGTGVSAASRAAQAAAVDDDLEMRLRGGGEKEVGPVMQWLLRSAPRLIEGSLVPQVRETIIADGISMPLVPAIPGWVGAYPHEARTRRVAQFLEKRSRRVWEKTVKYDVRKSFADSRLRVKGRFVKKEDEALLRDFCQLL
jgi:hypothetical protein